jgi:hypothetical protein
VVDASSMKAMIDGFMIIPRHFRISPGQQYFGAGLSSGVIVRDETDALRDTTYN